MCVAVGVVSGSDSTPVLAGHWLRVLMTKVMRGSKEEGNKVEDSRSVMVRIPEQDV